MSYLQAKTSAKPDQTALSVSFQHRPHSTRMQLRGRLDGVAELPMSDERIQFPLEVDLGLVTGVDSPGVRAWIGFIRAVTARGPVRLAHCPTVMTKMFSMIYGCTGQAHIDSVLAPYTCRMCKHEELCELHIGADIDPTHYDADPPAQTCSSCGALSEFDEIAESRHPDLPLVRIGVSR
jgi:hypothetical protein